MPITIGINGFGRIGRYLVRLLANSNTVRVAAVNARADNKTLAHILRYDSVHRIFNADIAYDDDGLIVNGRHIPVTRNAVGEIPWGSLGVDVAVETTGTIKDRAGLVKHNESGAKKTIISAPGKDVDATIVMGVNEHIYDPVNHSVLSNASCTTNCLAPVAKVINDTFGIKHGLMTTVHSVTMSQRILDGSHKDLRRARAAFESMVPTTTGAAKATTLVIPELAGKLDGMSIRVPTPNVSLVDLTCELGKDTSVEEINAVLKAASEGQLHEIMGYTETPLVSVDYTGSTHAGVVDGLCTQVIDKRLAKLIVWYDNESGFTNQLVRLLRLVGKKPV